jgi:mono/diheme cytochrome c family protein
VRLPGTAAAWPPGRLSPVALAALLLPLAALAGAPAQGDPRRGRAKYDALCLICHGPGGKGDGPTARMLTPRPRDLADRRYMAGLTDRYLRDIILKGGAAVGKSPLMPPWSSQLSEADVTHLIAYLRSLANR